MQAGARDEVRTTAGSTWQSQVSRKVDRSSGYSLDATAVLIILITIVVYVIQILVTTTKT